MAMWCAAMADREYDFAVERDESVTSMRRRLAETGPEFVDQVRQVAEEGRFDETFVDAFAPEPMVMTYGAMVAHVLTFAAHHRLLPSPSCASSVSPTSAGVTRSRGSTAR